MNKVIVIVGPTGVGKTKLSVELAKYFHSEIINGDSVQVYKKLDIGSAKVKENEKEGIKHHLLDIKNIEDNYTIYDYQKDVRNKIEEFHTKGLTPIIVGGSGLYLKAALYDYKFNEEESKDNLYEDLSNEEVYKLLMMKDEKEALKLHVNNRKRVVRALNIIEKSNKSKSDIVEEQQHLPLYDVCFIGLTLPRDLLYERINKRVDLMVQEGLVEEVRTLYKEYKNANYKSLQAIGYKELFLYFNNEISLEDAIELIKKKSRNYAKRQYTWFNNQFNTKWFNANLENFDETVKEVIDYVRDNNE